MKKTKEITNVKELRNQLVKVYESIQAGTLEYKAAREMNNTAGKILATLKVQMEYSSLKTKKPVITFLNCQ